jgi:dihydroorotase-like cyclic amidohydrolase
MPLNSVPPALDALEAKREAARDRLHVDVGAETCPHYLTFDAGTIPDGATQFKCCPPERKRLDSGDFGAAWGASPRSS